VVLLAFANPQQEEEVGLLILEASARNIIRTAGVVLTFDPICI